MYWARLCVPWCIYYLCCPVFAQSSSTVTSHAPHVTVYPTASSALTSIQSTLDHASLRQSTLRSGGASSHHMPMTTVSSSYTVPNIITRVPSPIVTNHPPNPPISHFSPRPGRNRPSGPSPGLIIGVVVGGIVGTVVLLSFARCLYSWRKQPARNRIAEVMNRHQVHREMEELAREDLEAFAASVRRAPSPPPLPLYNDSRLPAYTPGGAAADAN
ncbi:hypothetical protein NEOLEDRAFT_1238709, partial [Neolentinus lepideus HHB14362 ss-1]